MIQFSILCFGKLIQANVFFCFVENICSSLSFWLEYLETNIWAVTLVFLFPLHSPSAGKTHEQTSERMHLPQLPLFHISTLSSLNEPSAYTFILHEAVWKKELFSKHTHTQTPAFLLQLKLDTSTLTWVCKHSLTLPWIALVHPFVKNAKDFLFCRGY